MNYVIMALVGLVVGILARFFYPGPVDLGILMSAVLGIAGSFIAGFIGNMMSKSSDGRMRPAGFVWSVLGAMVLSYIGRQLGYV